MAAELATRIPLSSPDIDEHLAPVEQWRPAPGDRKGLLDAFLDIGAGVDVKRAHARTLAWYRSSGTGWTRTLG